jgi:hypothetical protein
MLRRPETGLSRRPPPIRKDITGEVGGLPVGMWETMDRVGDRAEVAASVNSCCHREGINVHWCRALFAGDADSNALQSEPTTAGTGELGRVWMGGRDERRRLAPSPEGQHGYTELHPIVITHLPLRHASQPDTVSHGPRNPNSQRRAWLTGQCRR